MKVKQKLLMDTQGLYEHGPVNIVIFGDSVSHGAFNDYIDYEDVYWNILRKKLNAFRDYIPVNMINASIGGTTAAKSLPRMERDVISHRPDLVVISFGLNDVNGQLKDYIDALRQMFDKCRKESIDTIFLTPNMLNTYVAEDTAQRHLDYAAKTAKMQNSGRMDAFIGAAVQLAEEKQIAVCDCYSMWKELSKTQDTTQLLANRINHPIPQMHRLFADSLYKIIMDGETQHRASDSTMYKEI